MRLFLLISSLAFFRVAHVIGDENLFSDGIYEPLDEWTTGPDLGDAPEPLFGNLDGAQLTQDTNLELASLSINDELNTDLWASCPASGLGKRDGEHPSCNVPLRKEEVPTLPTLREVEKAVGNTPNSEPDTTPLRVNDVVPLYRADSKCPPTNPWHLCCICDDAFALEVCQDCLLYGGVCVKPHIQVCCLIYGRTPNPGSGSFLDDWLDEGAYDPTPNYLDGVFAEDCFELYPFNL